METFEQDGGEHMAQSSVEVDPQRKGEDADDDREAGSSCRQNIRI